MKARLWQLDPDRRDIHNTHDLIELWRLCGTEFGPASAPAWVANLAAGHGPAFVYRYQSGNKDVDGNREIRGAIMAPAPEDVLPSLHEIFRRVGGRSDAALV